jgi:dTDP-4-dehydrorhamnose reductase
VAKQKLVVTGANGYLASLVRLFNADKFDIVPVRRADVDLSDPKAVEAYFSTLDFDVVFHTAACATTALCENDPELTHRINVESAQAVAEAAAQKGARLVFISTEQTVNGKTVPGPFDEDVVLESVTAYGRQKAEMDAWLAASDIDYVTLRLSWMMGLAMPGVKPSPNIVVNTLKALRTDTPTKFTVNEVRGMTYAQHLADEFGKIVELPRGVYNFTDVNDLCTYEAAKYVAREFGFSDDAIERCILPDNERYSDRFRDYRLDPTKLARADIDLGTFQENVAEVKRDFGW